MQRVVNSRLTSSYFKLGVDCKTVPHFCVFKYSRVRLLRHALPISLVILRKNPTVLQSKLADIKRESSKAFIIKLGKDLS